MKKAVILIALVLFTSTILAAFDNRPSLVCNKNTKVCHLTTCQYAKMILYRNIVLFKNMCEAKNNNYRACQVCQPGR